MTRNRRTPPSGDPCPVTFALDVFGDRWSLLLLRDLFFKRKRHYREFLESPEGISTNILADRLRTLESEGLLTKTRDERNRSRFVYALTDKGRDLLPTLLEIIRWSARYDPQPTAPDSIIVGAPSHLLKRMETDREGLIDEILDRLDEPPPGGGRKTSAERGAGERG